MNEHMVLKRRIAIQGWRVVGLVARADRRKELEPVLLRAREKHETGGTDAGDVAEHLLFERRSRKVVASRLLRIGTALGLLEENKRRYALTEDGERAIAAGKVFVPEHDAWTVWVSEDPLLPSPVLRIEAWDEPDAVTENRTRRDEEEERSFEPLPDMLREVQGTEIVPPASGDGAAVRIDDLEEQAEAVIPDGSLSLTWNVQERRLRVQGELDARKVDSELEAPDIPGDRIWDALLDGEGLSNHWDRQRDALRVSFGETTENERESMSRDLEFREPFVPCFEEFEPLEVRGTAIAAHSRDDAREWAAWRLSARIRDFATSERYDEWREEAAAPFTEHRPELPARAELARSEWESTTGRPAPRAWFLIAAEDWGL